MGKIILVVFSSIYCGLLLASGQYNLFFLVFVTPLFLFFVFKFEEFAVWMLIISIFLLFYLNAIGFLPYAVRGMVDATILALLLKVVLKKIIMRGRICLPFGGLILSASMIYLITSFIIFKVEPGVVLLGLRTNFKFILLFYLLINSDWSEQFFRKVLKVLLIIALVQVPVAIVQKLTWGHPGLLGMFGPQQLNYTDIAGGTFGGGDTTGFLACYLCGVVYVLVAFWRCEVITFNKLLLTVGALFIPLVLAQSEATYLLFPVGMLAVIMPGQKTGWSVRVAMTVLVVLSFGIILYLAHPELMKVSALQRKYEMEAAMDAYGGPSAAGKLAALEYAVKAINVDMWHRFFGYGLGSTASSMFTGISGSWTADVARYEFKPQVARVLLEMGWSGLIVLSILPFYLFNISRKLFRICKDSFWKSIALGFYGVFFIFISFAFYRTIWTVESTAFSFWFLAAAIFVQSRRIVGM